MKLVCIHGCVTSPGYLIRTMNCGLCFIETSPSFLKQNITHFLQNRNSVRLSWYGKAQCGDWFRCSKVSFAWSMQLAYEHERFLWTLSCRSLMFHIYNPRPVFSRPDARSFKTMHFSVGIQLHFRLCQAGSLSLTILKFQNFSKESGKQQKQNCCHHWW